MQSQLAKCQQKSTYFFNKIGSSFTQKDHYDWMLCSEKKVTRIRSMSKSKCKRNLQQQEQQESFEKQQHNNNNGHANTTNHLQYNNQQLHTILSLVGFVVRVVVGFYF